MLRTKTLIEYLQPRTNLVFVWIGTDIVERQIPIPKSIGQSLSNVPATKLAATRSRNGQNGTLDGIRQFNSQLLSRNFAAVNH
jgi:hypothetical protein